ncbi:MAG: D-alanyl-D-alanine carboxypeptidase family protein [Chthoniobacterales bacterium]
MSSLVSVITLTAVIFVSAVQASPKLLVRRALALNDTSFTSEFPDVHGKAWVLFDADRKEILLQKNANKRLPVASTQKLLTALLIAEAGGLDRNITIQPSDTLPPFLRLNFKAGEVYSRRDLLQVMLVRSLNDVAAALGRDHSGSVDEFVNAMNRRAKSLDAMDSNFKNPHGLPVAGQFSTARDIAVIASAVYSNRLLREMIRCEHYMITHPRNGRLMRYSNMNSQLLRYHFCNGVKTGYTSASGHCLVASGTWKGRNVIVVILGSDRQHIWKDSLNLLAYGLEISESDFLTLAASR